MLIDTFLLDKVYGSTLCLHTAAKFIVEQYTLEVSFYYYKRATEWKQMSA